jgi:hypothetical protein
MLRRVVLARTDVSEELSAKVTDSGQPDIEGVKFFRNVGFYNSHTA